MWLLSHSPSYLKNCGFLVKLLVTERKETLLPFLRKGERKTGGNFRQVSLTSVPGKIMEHILLEAMLRHV